MSEIAVVFHSATGTTARMAEAVSAGAARIAGTSAALHEIVPGEIADGRWRNDALLARLDAADAIVLGCPTFMGGPSAAGCERCDRDLPPEGRRVLRPPRVA